MMSSNQAFIIAAYAVTWSVIIGYTAYLVRRGGSARAGHERTSMSSATRAP